MITKKQIVVFALSLLFAGAAFAQDKQMGISPEMLSKIRANNKPSIQDKALRNIISAGQINKLAINNDNKTNYDTHFSNVVKNNGGISDQKSSGRCWMFAGFNVLRSKMITKYNLGEFNFSHNYIFFYDQLEKSNLFLSLIIDTRNKPMDDKTVDWLFHNVLSDGGQFTGIIDLVTKYGLVPASVQPETYNSDNTSAISSLITLKLKEDALKLRDNKKAKLSDLNNQKTEMLSTIYHMLVLAYGEPVQEFTYTMRDASGKVISTEKYTPKSFYDTFIGKDLTNDYVMFMNDPTRDFYKLYEITDDRHVADGHNWKYINLPMNEIKAMAISSIKDSTMMYFSCDVGKFLNRENGLLDVNNFDYASLMGTTFSMDKKQRIATFASGSSHAMTIAGVDLDDSGKSVKWLIENSWGASYGYKGHLIATDNWFDEYMFRLVVDKKYVPNNILTILNTKPTMLEPWDPMFAEDED